MKSQKILILKKEPGWFEPQIISILEFSDDLWAELNDKVMNFTHDGPEDYLVEYQVKIAFVDDRPPEELMNPGWKSGENVREWTTRVVREKLELHRAYVRNDCFLTAGSSLYIDAIKECRKIMRLNLKDAKDFVDSIRIQMAAEVN